MKPNDQTRPVKVSLPPNGVFVLESHHGPAFRMAPECHEFLEIFYVLDGAGTFHLAGRPCPCRSGDIIVVPVETMHRIEDNPAAPLALYGICLGSQLWRHEPSLLEHLPPGQLPVSKLLGDQVRVDLRRLLYEQTLSRPGSRTLVLGLALRLLALLAQSRLDPTPVAPASADSTALGHREAVARYAAELPHRFFEATNLDHVAAELGLSRRRFTALFRQVTGVTWAESLTQHRIAYACQLLRDTPRSIIAIAFESGYEDLSSFYRAFKRQTGMPPGAWRERRLGSGGEG